VDDRTQALVFIDFKSLGVRHLGSIYEGLLEFQLHIAVEKLAVTKEKGKEVYKPVRQVKKSLAIIDQGEVYLENDKRERKATGSYYTPDYIVKYIVRHTVGPVLDRKFQALENRLREAQRDYRNYVKLVEARRKAFGRDESAAVYWNNRDMQNLVDDCLNVRVLDPAMGSGHFLVEVVDYVSNRLIAFLNACSENPVWAFL
jgi:type I restriction-modification system DNA methylase subunit